MMRWTRLVALASAATLFATGFGGSGQLGWRRNRKRRGRGSILKAKRFGVAALMCGAALAAIMAPGQAWATLVTSLPGGTVYTFPPVDIFDPSAPITVAPGIAWSVQAGDGVYGCCGSGSDSKVRTWNYNYGDAGRMLFTFASPVRGVGGIFDWCEGNSLNEICGGGAGIFVLDPNSSTYLEYDIFAYDFQGPPYQVPPNHFYGLFDPTADIREFEVVGSFIDMTGLTVVTSSSPVPEPSTLPLFATGFCLMALLTWLRRRRVGQWG
jgi:hypothetical protein